MQEFDKDRNFEEIFESMRGSQRAKPNPDLFAKIEAKINTPDAKFISWRFRRLAAAAAILLLMMNVFVLQQLTQNTSYVGEKVTSETSKQSLISNYKIYD